MDINSNGCFPDKFKLFTVAWNEGWAKFLLKFSLDLPDDREFHVDEIRWHDPSAHVMSWHILG